MPNIFLDKFIFIDTSKINFSSPKNLSALFENEEALLLQQISMQFKKVFINVIPILNAYKQIIKINAVTIPNPFF